tara:strand:+ start:2504 stop:2839 length:336 start_codon:yes stop_codon:yes gene_type:complete
MNDDNSIVPIEIDLDVANKGEISEGVLSALGWQTKWLLKRMFGDFGVGNANITGTPTQIAAFASALGNEKRYLEAFQKYGLGDAQTFQSKWRLDDAVARFEGETGLKWPFN